MAGVAVIKREALAKERGISVNVIDNMLQRGQLKKVGHGLIDYEHAQKVFAAQDPQGREREIIRKATQSASQPVSDPVAVNPGAAAVSPPVAATQADTLLKARTAKVVHDARIAELDYKKKAGALVEIDKVKREAADVGRLIVARLRAFPARLGPMLASISDPAECSKLIEAEVTLLVMEVQEGIAAL